jgi:hypothetical protein
LLFILGIGNCLHHNLPLRIDPIREIISHLVHLIVNDVPNLGSSAFKKALK